MSKWENGESLPETYYLPLLSQILGVTIDELLTEKQEVTNKTKGSIKVENIKKAFDTIKMLKEYLGEDSMFYLGTIKGISEAMNFDFLDTMKNHENMLYAEAIIQMMHQGYSVDREEIEAFFNDNYKTYEKIQDYDTAYWENIFHSCVNKIKSN